MSVYNEIRSEVVKRDARSPFSPCDLLYLGRRGAVDNALSRLVKDQVVKRIGRGLYLSAQRAASDSDAGISGAAIAAAVARSEGAKVQMSGAEAAYRLGLSVDRPSECLYLTTGRSKRIALRNQIVDLRHNASPAMLGAGTQAGVVLSALRHLGEDGITSDVLVKIDRELSRSTARQLRQYRTLVPAWMRECIDALTCYLD